MTEPTESDCQKFIFQWARQNFTLMPELRLLNSRIAGVKLNPKRMNNLKAQGYVPGSNDIMLQVARCGYHSLNIELKRPKTGRVSGPQKKWLSMLNDAGNLGIVVHGHIKAIDIIRCYLRGDKEELMRLIK